MARFDQILLTADFDRTLTAPDSSIPERNLEAIRYFIENGGAFTVNTGRSLAMAQIFRDRVPMNAPLLLFNGSAAYDMSRDALDFCHEIQLDLKQTIGECLELFPDLTVEIQGLKAHYRFREEPGWDAFCRHNGCNHVAVRLGDDVGPFLKFSVYGQVRDVTVASFFGGTEEEIRRIDEAEAILTRKYGEFCEIFRAAPRILDIHAKGVSKARCARELQKKLGRKILVCVGDADNDLPMLYDADFAYAPADGAVADRFENVCPCADGAVADVIYEKIPKILESIP